MPIYDYECVDCGILEENCLTGVEEMADCTACGQKMNRLPPLVAVNMSRVRGTGYADPNLMAWISTDRQRKDLMKKQGVTEHGATPKTGPAWV